MRSDVHVRPILCKPRQLQHCRRRLSSPGPLLRAGLVAMHRSSLVWTSMERAASMRCWLASPWWRRSRHCVWCAKLELLHRILKVKAGPQSGLAPLVVNCSETLAFRMCLIFLRSLAVTASEPSLLSATAKWLTDTAPAPRCTAAGPSDRRVPLRRQHRHAAAAGGYPVPPGAARAAAAGPMRRCAAGGAAPAHQPAGELPWAHSRGLTWRMARQPVTLRVMTTLNDSGPVFHSRFPRHGGGFRQCLPAAPHGSRHDPQTQPCKPMTRSCATLRRQIPQTHMGCRRVLRSRWRWSAAGVGSTTSMATWANRIRRMNQASWRCCRRRLFAPSCGGQLASPPGRARPRLRPDAAHSEASACVAPAAPAAGGASGGKGCRVQMCELQRPAFQGSCTPAAVILTA